MEHEVGFYETLDSAATSLGQRVGTHYTLHNITENNTVSRLKMSNFDVVVFPGGSGSGQSDALGAAGRAAVVDFVRKGGGYIGTCGGAFLGMEHLKLYGDPPPPTVEPWARGHGPVSVEFNAEGVASLQLDRSTYTNTNVTIEYWQGPIVATANVPPSVSILSYFRTEIHSGHPNQTTGTMVNTPAMTSATFGSGRVVLNSPHPEIPPEQPGPTPGQGPSGGPAPVRTRPEIYAGELAWVLRLEGSARSAPVAREPPGQVESTPEPTHNPLTKAAPPTPRPLSFAGDFHQACRRELPTLGRLWGSRPHPDLSMVSGSALWHANDANLRILPRWEAAGGAAYTMPFLDEHVAVRFLGGVSPYAAATAPDCTDDVRGKVWCDLVTRRATDGAMVTRFDLLRARLDRYHDNGLDVMIVLDNVPFAFVQNASRTGPCETFGCQYKPPDNPSEFATWVGELASHLVSAYGGAWAARVRWRLGTEANGPRWGGRGAYLARYIDCYRRCARAIRAAIPRARIGASNWVEVIGHSGDLSPSGSDSFQFAFYEALAKDADADVPLDWVSVSHYGGGLHGKATARVGNFPGADYVQRTPGGKTGRVELPAMRALARRPNATLEVQEWSVLTNEAGEATTEPSALGTAWTAASMAAWVACAGADRVFHWHGQHAAQRVGRRPRRPLLHAARVEYGAARALPRRRGRRRHHARPRPRRRRAGRRRLPAQRQRRDHRDGRQRHLLCARRRRRHRPRAPVHHDGAADDAAGRRTRWWWLRRRRRRAVPHGRERERRRRRAARAAGAVGHAAARRRAAVRLRRAAHARRPRVRAAADDPRAALAHARRHVQAGAL